MRRKRFDQTQRRKITLDKRAPSRHVNALTELSVATATSGSRIDVRGSIVMRPHKSHGSGLMPTISALPGAGCADVSGFGVPEHPDNGSALQMLVQSGNLSFEIGYREDFS
jgi:hypothetical protein